MYIYAAEHPLPIVSYPFDRLVFPSHIHILTGLILILELRVFWSFVFFVLSLVNVSVLDPVFCSLSPVI